MRALPCKARMADGVTGVWASLCRSTSVRIRVAWRPLPGVCGRQRRFPPEVGAHNEPREEAQPLIDQLPRLVVGHGAGVGPDDTYLRIVPG